ncbi:hypothetical protein CsSME_00043656 [Camellia sinensis var. sinensis]
MGIHGDPIQNIWVFPIFLPVDTCPFLHMKDLVGLFVAEAYGGASRCGSAFVSKHDVRNG